MIVYIAYKKKLPCKKYACSQRMGVGKRKPTVSYLHIARSRITHARTNRAETIKWEAELQATTKEVHLES